MKKKCLKNIPYSKRQTKKKPIIYPASEEIVRDATQYVAKRFGRALIRLSDR